jgi:excisionase family DNA binding protein
VREQTSGLQLLTRAEACELLRLSPSTLDFYVATGQIPFVRLGRRNVRFRAGELACWLDSRSNLPYHRGASEEGD